MVSNLPWTIWLVVKTITFLFIFSLSLKWMIQVHFSFSSKRILVASRSCIDSYKSGWFGHKLQTNGLELTRFFVVKGTPNVTFLKLFPWPLIWNIIVFVNLIEVSNCTWLGLFFDIKFEMKAFLKGVLCCPKIGWISNFWGVMFLMVSSKDAFTL
jgi:hypothetical protein